MDNIFIKFHKALKIFSDSEKMRKVLITEFISEVLEYPRGYTSINVPGETVDYQDIKNKLSKRILETNNTSLAIKMSKFLKSKEVEELFLACQVYNARPTFGKNFLEIDYATEKYYDNTVRVSVNKMSEIRFFLGLDDNFKILDIQDGQEIETIGGKMKARLFANGKIKFYGNVEKLKKLSEKYTREFIITKNQEILTKINNIINS